MAIQFDTLPTENPFALPAPGIYKAKIVEAEMRKPKTKYDDGSEKPPYLNLKYALIGPSGNSVGSIYDIISESDSSVVQYKIARFLTACGIPLVGSMELADIAKLVLNKEIVVDVNHDTKGQQPRAQVDLFSHEAYYPIDKYDEISKIVAAEKSDAAPASEEFTDAAPEEVPFEESGAMPAPATETVEY